MINKSEREKSEKLFHFLSAAYEQVTHHDIPMTHLARRGDYIFKEGTISHGLYYIRSGWVKIIGTNKIGEETVLHLATTNEFIGFLSLINQRNYVTSAVTIEDAEVYFIPKQIFTQLLQTDIEFAKLVIEILYERIVRMEEADKEKRSMDVSQRLASLLLALEYAYDLNPKYKSKFIRLPKKDIAAILSIQPETLSRALKEFSKKQLIVLHDRSIELVDHDALIAMSKMVD